MSWLASIFTVYFDTPGYLSGCQRGTKADYGARLTSGPTSGRDYGIKSGKLEAAVAKRTRKSLDFRQIGLYLCSNILNAGHLGDRSRIK